MNLIFYKQKPNGQPQSAIVNADGDTTLLKVVMRRYDGSDGLVTRQFGIEPTGREYSLSRIAPNGTSSIVELDDGLWK